MKRSTIPVTHVYAAPQRNQSRARGISSGNTFLRESASYVLASCAFTKLKNHRCPIHITPATTCAQRKIAFSHSLMESPRLVRNRRRAPYRLRIDPSREGPPFGRPAPLPQTGSAGGGREEGGDYPPNVRSRLRCSPSATVTVCSTRPATSCQASIT